MTDHFIDELTPVAAYMAAEMNKNPTTTIGRRIRSLNEATTQKCLEAYQRQPWWLQLFSMSPEDCAAVGMSNKAAAVMLWRSQVTYQADWDHKPHLGRMRHLWSKTLGRHDYHVYGTTVYGFDVWSNVHYGYVGRAVGFSAGMLLDGAGLAQLMNDTKKSMRSFPKKGVIPPWERPFASGQEPGLRKWDRPEDRESIRLGIKLYQKRKALLTPQLLVEHILRLERIRKKPLAAFRRDNVI